MPGFIKVGITHRSLDQRMAELHSTGTPLSFEVEAAFRILSPEMCEAQVHKALDKYRANRKREFFEISTKDALQIAWPIIFSHFPSSGQTWVSAKDTDSVLLAIHNNFSVTGASIAAISDTLEIDEAELTPCLERLKGMSLLKEQVELGATSSIWRLTDEGIGRLGSLLGTEL